MNSKRKLLLTLYDFESNVCSEQPFNIKLAPFSVLHEDNDEASISLDMCKYDGTKAYEFPLCEVSFIEPK